MKICENSTITRLSLGAAFVLGTAISANAANFQAFGINNAPLFNNDGENFTTGFQFTTTTSLTVNALGVYRGGFDGVGISTPRTVTLWQVNPIDPNVGTALISRTISDSGPSSDNTFLSGDGNFRYYDLVGTSSSFSLAVGTYRLSTYIATGARGDNALFDTLGISFLNQSLLNANPIPNGVQLNGGDAYPSQLIPGAYSISANMILDDGTGGGGTTTPEPSLVSGLILLGLGGLFQKVKR